MMHFTSSCLTWSLDRLVSNKPGVSTKTTDCPLNSPVAFWQHLLTEFRRGLHLKHSLSRIVFAVGLFPEPVFPTSTILRHSLRWATLRDPALSVLSTLLCLKFALFPSHLKLTILLSRGFAIISLVKHVDAPALIFSTVCSR